MKDIGFVVVGAGNLGTNLSLALQNAGWNPLLVINRSSDKGNELASRLNCDFSAELKIPQQKCVVFLCTPDDSLSGLVAELNLTQNIIVHCSGSTSMDIFKGKFKNYGVFYPLQSFTRGIEPEWTKIPLLIEASDEYTFGVLEKIAGTLSRKLYRLDSENRLKCHLSAVFAANFSNHLVYIAENLLKDSGLPSDILYPLLNETIDKLENHGAYLAQTGPARRNDRITMEKHLKILEEDPSLQKLYIFVSDQISKLYKT